MIEKVKLINWTSLNATDVFLLLQRILETDKASEKEQAYNQLSDRIIPWEIVEGYGSADQLKAIVSNNVTLTIIPLLIEMLKTEKTEYKSFILNLLRDLTELKYLHHRYLNVDRYEWYEIFATKIHNAILEGRPIYSKIAESNNSNNKQSAIELLNLLK